MATVIYDAAGYASVTPEGVAAGVKVVWITNDRNAGGTYADDGYDYPYRFVFHEIQGGANPNNISGHPYPPHIWYDPIQRILYQTVPLGRSAFALYQSSSAPYRTNKARAIQCELAGYSEFVANEPEVWLRNIAEDVLTPVCVWVGNKGGPIDLLNLPRPWQIAGSAYENAPQRFQPQQWANFNGVCAHANVPMGDDHWDTGALDIWRISQHAAYLISDQLDTTVKEGNVMPDLILKDPTDTFYGIYGSGLVRQMVWTEVVLWRDVKKSVEYREVSANEGIVLHAQSKK